jgi:hypothetical protein
MQAGSAAPERLSAMWYYTFFTLALWIVAPEIRRIFDWQFGFSNISVFAALPLLATIPHALALTLGGGWKRLPQMLAIAAWLWIGGFAYALVLSLINGNGLPGAYAFAGFVFPIGVGLWIASVAETQRIVIRRVTHMLFFATTLASIYGIVQYVILPPWDAFWLKTLIANGSNSFGLPQPMEIRAFSTFASPGPFAAFLGCMLLLSLPQLTPKRPWLLAQMPLWLVAFALTLGRAGWVLFALGLAVYVLLAARRGTVIAAIALCCAVVAAASVLLSQASASDRFTTDVVARLQTLGDLNDDVSASDRQSQYSQGFREFEAAPLGLGLGLLGVATKLGAAEKTTDFDSGVVARLIEMGIPGTLLLVAAFSVCLLTLLLVWADVRAKHVAGQSTAAAAIAVLVGVAGYEVFGDVTGFLVLILWLSISLALPSERGRAAVRIRAEGLSAC